MLGQVSSQVGFAELEAASRKLDLTLEVADIRRPEDLDGAFATMINKRVEALLIVVGPLTYLLRQPIADAALKYRLPAMTNVKQFAQAGLLMSYGPEFIRISTGEPRSTSTRSSVEPCPPICQSSSRRSSS